MRARLRLLWGEPVLIWGAIQAAVVMADGFGWLRFLGIHGQDSEALLLVVLNAAAAVHIAVVTHHTVLAPLVELFKALAGLGVVYGLHISNQQTAQVIVVVLAVAAAWHRTQTTPEVARVVVRDPGPPQAA